jgi:flagellar biosynthesis regulator FlaF
MYKTWDTTSIYYIFPLAKWVVERKNRTLVESTHNMLQAAQTSHGFWVEAITTANYLQNKITTKVVAHCISEEVWTGHKLTMKHLHTFR